LNIIIATLSAPTNEGRNGGAQFYILHLAIELNRRGHNVKIIGGTESRLVKKLPRREIINGVEISRYGSIFFPLIGIINHLRKEFTDADLVLENMMNYPLYLPLFFPKSKKTRALKHHFLGREGSNILGPIKFILNKLNEDILIPWFYDGKSMMVPSAKTGNYLKNKNKKFNNIKIIPPGNNATSLAS